MTTISTYRIYSSGPLRAVRSCSWLHVKNIDVFLYFPVARVSYSPSAPLPASLQLSAQYCFIFLCLSLSCNRSDSRQSIFYKRRCCLTYSSRGFVFLTTVRRPTPHLFFSARSVALSQTRSRLYRLKALMSNPNYTCTVLLRPLRSSCTHTEHATSAPAGEWSRVH